MKIIQVSDTHLVEAGGRIYGLDPQARLRACVADINACHADADLCVLSGDLCDSGSLEAYRILRSVLADLEAPYHLMIGNHDRREAFLEVFPETPQDSNGFVQYALEMPAGRLLLLDTVEPGTHGGSYCARRSAWLSAELKAAGGEDIYIFMHHPPFPIGIPSMDRTAIDDPAHFEAALDGHGNIRHIFFGHVHRPLSGSWRGIAISALPSTVHQVALDLETVSPVPKTLEPPAYAVILIEPGRTLVHLKAFLDQSPIEGAVSPPPP